MRVRLGCTGWSYADWVGPFYPPGTPPGKFLARYARVFDVAEVDSTFYRMPTEEQARRWAEATPAGFTFLPKVPRALTHDARLRDVAEPVDALLRGLAPLRRAGKLGALVAQLPASFRREPATAADLTTFLDLVPRDVRVAVELRHASWWHQGTFEALGGRGAALVWSVQPHAEVPAQRTADFVYVRMVGDRALTRFDRVQRDLRDAMVQMKQRLEAEGKGAREVFVLLNNHFMGFAPQTAAVMAEVLALPPPDLARAARREGQRALGEF